MAFAQGWNMQNFFDGKRLTVYLVAALMIGLFFMIFSNRVYNYRERKVVQEAKEVIAQLGLVLKANKTQIWTLDLFKRVFTLFSNEGDSRTEQIPMDFSQRYEMSDYLRLRELITALKEGRQEEGTITMRGNSSSAGSSIGSSTSSETAGETCEVNLSVLKRNKQGEPIVLIGIERDTSDEKRRTEEARRLAMRYHTVFNSSLVDMIYYDKDGLLTDINDKALETFGVSDRESLLKRGVKITDIPSYRHLDINTLESINISSITDIDRTKREDERIPEANINGRMYYEVSVSSVHDDEGQLQGVVTAGRNITEMVNSHHRQQEYSQLLKKRNKEIEEYISNINYTLRVSGVRLMNYYPERHELEISSDLKRAEYRLSQMRCISLIAIDERRRARGLLRRMDRKAGGNFAATLKTVFKDNSGRPMYMTFNVVPVKNTEGQITHYFGMLRNDTELHYTEIRLQEETQKAQETERLKDTFLQNMSYEIRTPLNAVIGFAELYNAPHDTEDEVVFAEEIKHNTADLLTLVNDILTISRLDAKMVELSYRECDFAVLFDGYCYMGLSLLAEGVTVNIENPYSSLIVTIDETHLGEVIQKICAFAAHYTTAGQIKAKYEYRHGELNIAIEDTGIGFSPEELKHAFDRFGSSSSGSGAEEKKRYGTGLDLPIIKELVTQMGGTIELQSEQRKGSTVYVIIPCVMSTMEKKTEMKSEAL
jgi:PAS domain S-box-containing protein